MKAKIIRVAIQNLLRKSGLLPVAEQIRYRLKLLSLKKENQKFVDQFPNFLLPPPHLAFDAYSAPDWSFYKTSGEGTAAFLANDVIQNFVQNKELPLAVYEWGCGPARVVRHLPNQLKEKAIVYGTDYNPETIKWVSENIPNVRFSLNDLNPPLSFKDETFDFIYSISVFTHLSEATGLNWIHELHRVLKPGGVVLITTSGNNAFETELLSGEQEKYNEQGIVVRGDYEEGKKMYLTRHNPTYVKEKLLKNFEVIKHAPAGFPFIAQDYWIARKKKS